MSSIIDWMKATYVSSLEYCGEDIDDCDLEEPYLNILNYINDKKLSYIFGSVKKPRLYCLDGFNISIQGGYGNYSNPKKTVEIYDTMEIGFPSEICDLCEVGDVAGYVTVKELQRLVDEHGGIDFQKSLKNYNYTNAKKYLRELKLKRILNEYR